MRLINLIADRVDLAIDLLTLGQYGLEPAACRGTAAVRTAPARVAGCEGGAAARCAEHREALPTARGRGCTGRTSPTSPPAAL